MEITPISSYSPLSGVDARPGTSREARPAGDAGEFKRTEAVQRAMALSPDVRPEVVARGKELVASESYPPQETIRRLGRFVRGRAGSGRQAAGPARLRTRGIVI